MNQSIFVIGALALAATTMMLSVNKPFNAQSDLEMSAENKYNLELIQFKNWLNQHSKVYHNYEEFIYRFSIFRESLAEIQAHKLLQKSYTKGLTAFADIPQYEFQMTYLNPKLVNDNQKYKDLESKYKLIAAKPRNEFLNWTAQGKVGPVNNQGKCGSCYSFAATESIQSAYAIFQGELPQLSEEQIVQCSISYGNNGCGGGDPDITYEYVMHHPLNTETNYPYTSGADGTTGTCNEILENQGSYGIDGYGCIEPLNCEAIVERVNQQPLYVGVNASNWKLYTGGIFPPEDCATQHNHGVLFMGYGPDYWLIQNSWGTGWGENGYIQISNQPNTCGSCSEPCFPVIHF